jgi:hypothetical protein
VAGAALAANGTSTAPKAQMREKIRMMNPFFFWVTTRIRLHGA